MNAAAKVFEFYRKNPEGATAHEVAKKLGGTRQTVVAAVSRLVVEGKLVRVGKRPGPKGRGVHVWSCAKTSRNSILLNLSNYEVNKLETLAKAFAKAKGQPKPSADKLIHAMIMVWKLPQ